MAGRAPGSAGDQPRRLQGAPQTVSGQIKGILTRGDFVAGIGNAYADEVLWWARVRPYCKRTSLTAAEVDRLCDGMRACLLEATEKVRAEMGEDIHLKPQR